MFSKFVAKAFVRDEVAVSANKTQQEIIATSKQKLQLIRKTTIRPDNTAQCIAALKSEIQTLNMTLGHHDKKLGRLI